MHFACAGALSAWAIDDGMVANIIQSDVTFHHQSNQAAQSCLIGNYEAIERGPQELVNT